VSAAALLALPDSPAALAICEDASTNGADFPLAENPFISVCLLLCLYNGRVKTVAHREQPAIVLDETKYLRRIFTAGDFENKRMPFWVCRRSADRKEINVERVRRSRSHYTPFAPPHWEGTPFPSGYRRRAVETEFPSVAYLRRLASLNYPAAAIQACLMRAHKPFTCSADQHRFVPKNPKDNYEDSGAKKVGAKASARGIAAFQDPLHPYHPTAPARRTLTGVGIPLSQVTREIARHRWDDVTSSCVLDIVYRRHSPSELSEKHGIPLRRLHEYARQIRKGVKSNPLNDFAH